ncbi:MAG: prolyl oligopeptidase family serine peptidase [Chloroflexaceae bacterium]|nr:prolyl oligopeptidase family serine peptidase [Chloroflexaceae bacterium]
MLAPDYRGYGGGDDGPNQFYTGYYADILHLIPMAQRLPMARPDPVGLWGHSRGASINVAAITIMPERIAAAVVYAPAYADLELDYYRRYNASGGNPGTDTWPFPPSANPDAYRRVSPLYAMDVVQAPVQLHHGTLDPVVDISASVQIADTLRSLTKNVEFYVYEGSGHLFGGYAEQLYYERTMAFLNTYVPR